MLTVYFEPYFERHWPRWQHCRVLADRLKCLKSPNKAGDLVKADEELEVSSSRQCAATVQPRLQFGFRVGFRAPPTGPWRKTLCWKSRYVALTVVFQVLLHNWGFKRNERVGLCLSGQLFVNCCWRNVFWFLNSFSYIGTWYSSCSSLDQQMLILLLSSCPSTALLAWCNGRFPGITSMLLTLWWETANILMAVYMVVRRISEEE